MIRELITRPIQAANALIELPWTINRSLRQANDLMEASRRQLEVMQRQTDEALVHAERMNEMLSKVVRLTEPIEMAAKGGEYAAGALKRVIFGAVEDAETAAGHAETAAIEAEDAASHADHAVEHAADHAGDASEASEEAEQAATEPDPRPTGGVPVSDSNTIRVIPNRPPPGEPDGS